MWKTSCPKLLGLKTTPALPLVDLTPHLHQCSQAAENLSNLYTLASKDLSQTMLSITEYMMSWGKKILAHKLQMSKESLSGRTSVANKRFIVGQSMNWGSEGHFEIQLVQERWIFLLPESTKNGENQCWFILYHIYMRYSHEK